MNGNTMIAHYHMVFILNTAVFKQCAGLALQMAVHSAYPKLMPWGCSQLLCGAAEGLYEPGSWSCRE